MLGRPQETEAAPYYFTYINQVTGNDPLAVINSQLRDSLEIFSGISSEQSLYRYAPSKWSIRELLNHVTDTERAFAFRSLWFARGFETSLESYDQNIAAAGAEADRVDWADHVRECRARASGRSGVRQRYRANIFLCPAVLTVAESLLKAKLLSSDSF